MVRAYQLFRVIFTIFVIQFDHVAFRASAMRCTTHDGYVSRAWHAIAVNVSVKAQWSSDKGKEKDKGKEQEYHTSKPHF
jgi:hypothetical protein